MTPIDGRRKNTPAEDANSAPRFGLDLIEALLRYLSRPSSEDANRDWSPQAAALEASAEDLRGLVREPLGLATDAPVPSSVVDSFRRADTAVQQVVLLASGLDGAGIHHRINDFRERWHSAAAGVEPYDK